MDPSKQRGNRPKQRWRDRDKGKEQGREEGPPDTLRTLWEEVPSRGLQGKAGGL